MLVDRFPVLYFRDALPIFPSDTGVDPSLMLPGVAPSFSAYVRKTYSWPGPALITRGSHKMSP